MIFFFNFWWYEILESCVWACLFLLTVLSFSSGSGLIFEWFPICFLVSHFLACLKPLSQNFLSFTSSLAFSFCSIFWKVKIFFLIYVTAGGIFLLCKSLKQKSFGSEACGILVYSSLALPRSPKAESMPSALETWSLDHWLHQQGPPETVILISRMQCFLFFRDFLLCPALFFSEFFFLASLFCFGVFLVRSFSQVSIALFFFAWWEGACLPTQGESSPWNWHFLGGNSLVFSLESVSVS